MSDLIIDVRQIGSYPQLGSSTGNEVVLLQEGPIGSPYASISTANLVSTALYDGPALGVGLAPPANADGGVFTGTLTEPADGAIAWNAYLNNGDWRLLTSGSAASIGWDSVFGFDFATSTAGASQAPLVWVPMMRLDNAGNLSLPNGTLTVSRDPAALMDVATLNWVSNNTVNSFNQRQGQVQLNAQDVYQALKLCDPLATQPWVNQAITNSIQNLLYTCPFVNTWNGRQGQVYLMLSDITCVFYQSGQQPISPTPIPTSNDDSIATTRWVTQAFQPDGGTFLPISGGTMQGPLIWTATGTTQPRSAQDRSADAVNVRDFGAVGDGSTDDTQAFQAAIATGHVIHVPRGTYITGPLTLNQAMYGDAIDATILLLRAGTTGMPNFITWGDPGPSTIRDLTIDGNNLAGAGIMTSATLPQTALRIEDVEVRNIGEASATVLRFGIMLNWDQSTQNMKTGCVITNCYVHDIVGAGITAGGQGHIIASNVIVNCGHSGVNCWGALTDGVIANNTINTTGTNLNASSDGISGYSETNLRVLVTGNTVENSINHGIHLGGANIQIVGNKIHQVINGSGIALQSAPNDNPTPEDNGTIANNEIDTVATGNGILCGFTARVAVNGNTVFNIAIAPAILFLSSADCVCLGNIVFNGANHGISLDTSPNTVVGGNRIADVAGRGINDNGTTTVAFGNVISNEGLPTLANLAGPPPPWAPLASPSFSGTVTLPGNAAAALQAVPLQQLTATVGGYLPLTGGTSTGAINMMAPTGVQMNYAVASDAPTSMYVQNGNSPRWRWLWSAGAETGGNAGADFQLQYFDDTGAQLPGQAIAITRATGLVTLGRGAQLGSPGQPVGFYGVTPVIRQGVFGSRTDPGTGGGAPALVNLLAALTATGIINDGTTP